MVYASLLIYVPEVKSKLTFDGIAVGSCEEFGVVEGASVGTVVDGTAVGTPVAGGLVCPAVAVGATVTFGVAVGTVVDGSSVAGTLVGPTDGF